MISYFKSVKGNVKQLKTLEDYAWVRAFNPTTDELKFLIKKFKLEKDLIVDALDKYEMPRVEVENGVIYVFIRVPTSKIENEFTASFLLILTNKNFITISRESLEIFDKVLNLKIDTKNISDLLSKILSFVSKLYSSSVRRILSEVKTEKRHISKLTNKDILNLVFKEDILNDYLSSFSPLIWMYRDLLKTKSMQIKKQDKEFIEDLIVDLEQTLNSCKSALKTITNMRDYYSTTLSSNLNNILTVLTVFTVFLTIPTVIGGIYGMNISLPMQHYSNIFWILMGIVGVIWAIMFLILRKSGVI